LSLKSASIELCDGPIYNTDLHFRATMHSADLLVQHPLQAAFAHVHGTFATLKLQLLTLEPGSIFITRHEPTTIYKGFSWFHPIAKYSVLHLYLATR
jgi:hypothetical protein